MISRGLVWALGFSQLVLWGVTYYLVAVFGEPIARETGWSRPVVYGGFSLALVVMGLVSSRVGRTIDRHGGRPVMVAGSLLTVLGLCGLSVSGSLPAYYASWAVLGLAMRMSLYDAAFAALARAGGPAARRPISQITLLGGLASTALWPIGQALVEGLGWRPALLVYAALALATTPLHVLIPPARFAAATGTGPRPIPPRADTAEKRRLAGLLYAVTVTLTSFLNSAMSAHMIAIMTGLGLAAGVAVWTATLRGVGQSAARGAEILFGRRLDPLALGVLATAALPFGFLVGLGSGGSLAAAIGFALIYGAGNGLVTIVRGTQPLVLFDPASYGEIVGRLVGPSFILAALAPTVFALVVDELGAAFALYLSAAVALAIAASAFALWRLFPKVPEAKT